MQRSKLWQLTVKTKREMLSHNELSTQFFLQSCRPALNSTIQAKNYSRASCEFNYIWMHEGISCYESWSFVINKLFCYIIFCQCRLTLRYSVRHQWYAFTNGAREEIVKRLAGKKNTIGLCWNIAFLWKMHIMYVVLFIKKENRKGAVLPNAPRYPKEQCFFRRFQGLPRLSF